MARAKAKQAKIIEKDISENYNVTVVIKRKGFFALLQKLGILKPKVYQLGVLDLQSLNDFSVKGISDPDDIVNVVFIKTIN